MVAIIALVISLAVIQHTVARCPEVCICDDKGTVDCKARNLTSIPEGIPLNATELLLANNALKILDLDILKELSDLSELYVSNNKIKTIRGSFEYFPHLLSVHLDGNELETLSPDTFGMALAWIQEVWLKHNPWRCDCNLKWMVLEMRNRFSAFGWQTTQCESPEQFRGKYSFELDVDKMVCTPAPALSQQHVIMISASAATVLIGVVATAIFCSCRSTPGADAYTNLIEDCSEVEDQSGLYSPPHAQRQTIDEIEGVSDIASASDTDDTGPKRLRSVQPTWLQHAQDEVESQDVYGSSISSTQGV